jgi:hypothetical protein
LPIGALYFRRLRRIFAMYAFAAREPFTIRAGRALLARLRDCFPRVVRGAFRFGRRPTRLRLDAARFGCIIP